MPAFGGRRDWYCARANEAVELIYRVGQGFSANKNGQTDEDFDLSTPVNRIGEISNHFTEDLFHPVTMAPRYTLSDCLLRSCATKAR